MQLLPWFREEFYSPLPPAELLRRLQMATAPTPTSDAPLVRPDAIFQGWVSADSFRIGRVSRRRNKPSSPFTAVEGTIVATATGSRLQLLHRPVLFALFALGFWLVLDSVFVVAALISWLRNQPGEYTSWGPPVVFVGALVLFLALFWWEVWQERTMLMRLLDLRPAAPA